LSTVKDRLQTSAAGPVPCKQCVEKVLTLEMRSCDAEDKALKSMNQVQPHSYTVCRKSCTCSRIALSFIQPSKGSQNAFCG
jgi:hypothetical protein